MEDQHATQNNQDNIQRSDDDEFDAVLRDALKLGRQNSNQITQTLRMVLPWARIPNQESFTRMYYVYRTYWEMVKDCKPTEPRFLPYQIINKDEEIDINSVPTWYHNLLREHIKAFPETTAAILRQSEQEYLSEIINVTDNNDPSLMQVDDVEQFEEEQGPNYEQRKQEKVQNEQDQQQEEDKEEEEEEDDENEKEEREPPPPPQPLWKISEPLEPDQATVEQFINECNVYFATYRHLNVKRPPFPKYFYGKEKLVPKFLSAKDQKTFDDPEVSEEEKAALVPKSDIPDWFRKLCTADKRKREKDRKEGKYPAIETTSLRDPTKEQFMEWWNQIKEYHSGENDILPPRFPKYPFTISGAVSKKYGFTVKNGKKIYKNSPSWWYKLREEWRKEREEAKEVNLGNKNRILPLKPFEMSSNLNAKEAVKKIQERQAGIDKVIAIGRNKDYRHWKLKTTSVPRKNTPQTPPPSTRPITVSFDTRASGAAQKRDRKSDSSDNGSGSSPNSCKNMTATSNKKKKMKMADYSHVTSRYKTMPPFVLAPKKSTTFAQSREKSTSKSSKPMSMQVPASALLPVSPDICTTYQQRVSSNDGKSKNPVQQQGQKTCDLEEFREAVKSHYSNFLKKISTDVSREGCLSAEDLLTQLGEEDAPIEENQWKAILFKMEAIVMSIVLDKISSVRRTVNEKPSNSVKAKTSKMLTPAELCVPVFEVLQSILSPLHR